MNSDWGTRVPDCRKSFLFGRLPSLRGYATITAKAHPAFAQGRFRVAGHFVMWRLPLAVHQTYIGLPGVTWSALQHSFGTPNGAGGLFPGWAQVSRDQLNRVRSGINIPDRNDIPPHRYLGFPPGAPGPALAAQMLADRYGWIREIERRTSPGFGMVALCPNAAAAWQSGDPYSALVAQITHGATSVEVYYLGNREVS